MGEDVVVQGHFKLLTLIVDRSQPEMSIGILRFPL